MERGPIGVLPTSLLNRITHSRSLWHEPFIGIYNCRGSIPVQGLSYGCGLTKQRPLSRVFTRRRELDRLHGRAMNFKTAMESVVKHKAAATFATVALAVISNDIMVLLL